MGLLEPTSGNVLVDGLPIVGSRRRAWQRKVAHVPQSIFLIDASLAENIAFGVHQDEVDMTRVREAASLAVIANFIESSPEGYNARVGERGIRLSGGQRQRIGIARALYKRASVLVLDEATSALDNETERLVIDSINRYGDGLTVIVVAHRLKTVERCDIIYQLDGGRLVAQGTLEELLSNNSSFRQMASLVD
jgi:ATP-binding cassette subfamily B protein